MNHIEVMKQALGVLDQVASAMPFPVAENARKSLRAAIAEAESQQGLPEPKQYPKMPNVIPPAAQPAVPLTTMQPIVDVNGVKRFKANAIVCHLIDTHPSCDMNVLSRMDFSDEDRMQFAQLIGYSLSGYGELSYVSDESYDAAEKAAHGINGEPK